MTVEQRQQWGIGYAAESGQPEIIYPETSERKARREVHDGKNSPGVKIKLWVRDVTYGPWTEVREEGGD